MTRLRTLLLGWLLWLSAPAISAAQPLGMFTDIPENGVHANGAPAVLLGEFQSGDKLSLAKNAKATLVYYANGKEYILTGPSEVALNDEGPTVNGKVIAGEILLLSSEGAQLVSSELAQAAIVMRRINASKPKLSLTYPVKTRILEARPYFEWQVDDEAKDAAYRLEILSDKGKVLFTAHTDKPRLRLPKEVVLPRGERLTWELEAEQEGGKSFASADFALVTEEVVERVGQLRAQAGTDFARLVLLSRYLESQHLNAEARDYWQKLAKMRPDNIALKEKINK